MYTVHKMNAPRGRLLFTPVSTLLLASLIEFSSVGATEKLMQVENNCPTMCTCHTGHISQLSFANIIYPPKKPLENTMKFTLFKESHKGLNEVLQEEEIMNNDYDEPALTMATCIIQEENVLGRFMTSLQNTEMLTLLQNSNTANITLTKEYFQELENLQVLEIIGLKKQKLNKSSHKTEFNYLFLKHNALQVMKVLKYINLQNIQLLGDRNQGNKILPKSAYEHTIKKFESNEIKFDAKIRTSSRSQLERNLETNLVFLSPNQLDDVLPYEVYKEHLTLGTYSFAGLKQLKFLRISRCGLKEINWETFEGLHNLETLFLDGNQLLFIPEFAFYGASQLKALSLVDNKLLDIQYWSFAGLLQLQNLDISNNNITHLSELSLPPLPQLVTADFRNNPIEMIFPSTFEVMNATQHIHIGSLYAKLNIQRNSFSGLHSLQTLKLININLEALEKDLITGMPKLEKIEIVGSIRTILFDTFMSTPKLQEITIKNCSLEYLSMDSFYGLHNLKILDLSNNLLTYLPPGLFDQQYSLKELYLQNNNLTTLPIGLFDGIPARVVRLDGNPWHCTCAMKQWKQSVVNQVKQTIRESSRCQSKYDKGLCRLTMLNNDEYVYNKEVEPRCETPVKYKDWYVFHVMRKQLRCHENNKQTEFNRTAYLTQKILEYERIKQNNLTNYSTKKRHKDNKTKQNIPQRIQQLYNKPSKIFYLNKDYSKIVNDQHLDTPTESQNLNTCNNKSDKTNIEHSLDKYKKVEDKRDNKMKDIFSQFNSIQKQIKSDHVIDLTNVVQFNKEKLNKKERQKLQLLKEKTDRRIMKTAIKMSENLSNTPEQI